MRIVWTTLLAAAGACIQHPPARATPASFAESPASRVPCDPARSAGRPQDAAEDRPIVVEWDMKRRGRSAPEDALLKGRMELEPHRTGVFEQRNPEASESMELRLDARLREDGSYAV